MNRVIIIIPAYNEEASIDKVCSSIINYNKKASQKYDFIVINDCSLDNTEDILKKNHYPHISLVQNLGIGGAVQTGYKYALENDYDIAVQFDGDGQHDVEYIKTIIDPIINNEADLVIGSRFIENNSNFRSTFARRIGINIISCYMKHITKKKVYDTTSGFRACNRAIISEFAKEYPREYPEPITTTEVIKKGYRVEEKSVKMNERTGGVSSIRKWKNFYYMINVLLSLFVVRIRRYK